MSQRCDVLVPEGRDAVFVHSVPVRLLGMLISILGVLKRLLGMLLPGLAILFLMGLRSTTVGLRRKFVLLGGLSVCLVRNVPPAEAQATPPFLCTRRANFLSIGVFPSNGAGLP
jgi:hypothetical protein